ncbi:IQ calmodulin-binding motif protein, putative (macronuclear) [Tetrahymena thermophila SB210]|uniref:histone acetyltransferase n=1 Tax=Tetrahymena thermophila (strain SB210) TaxID=312017 RepID=I7MI58_TETTS|nr:IQ calmodulin-binding motif protein, putative [Tetrahymena thermophila SB210]EAR90906.2 IQ calmodulin-binding motif protein, putative [Tetrahymena thermophila SB210]|eukprot:XP_001011151.2 IQ calmodulin-binding motif protein, putative [Tetrahymena thermophila SB210]
MNSHISEEYFPQSTGNNRMQIKKLQNQEVTSNQPQRNNFMKSVLKQNAQNSLQSQNSINQNFRNQSSPSPQCNQQKVITGRRLDNQSISINTNSSSTKMLQIQRLPLMNESSRKRMNSDTESSMFTNRNLHLPVEQNQADIQVGDSISMIKCESARVSQKSLVKYGQNFFSSVKKIPENQTEYQLQHANEGTKNGIILSEYELQQNKLINIGEEQDKVENHMSSNQMESKSKNTSNKKTTSPNKYDKNKKDIKKRIEVKKEMLASTLSPNTTNNSKQISTNDGSNKENMEQILQSQELIQQQQQQQQQQLDQNNIQKQTKKVNRKSASQTFSPTQIKHIQKLLNNKESKKKKKNQLFLYSNLSSPKHIAKLEISGTLSSKGQHLIQEIATPNGNINKNNLESQTIQQDFQNGKNKISNSLTNEIQQQNKYLQAVYQNQNYISSNNNQNHEQKLSQQSSASDLVMQTNTKTKNKKTVSNGNGFINQNSQISQNRQVSVNKKISQNSSHNSLHIAHKKQNSISNISKNHNEGNINNSPLHKTHRQTASLQINSSQPQIQVYNQDLKRQKSEEFLLFINENATKIQKEIEDKKKKEEEERQKKLVEKALLKQKNETIRQKNLIRYTLKQASLKNKQQNQQHLLTNRNQNDASKKINLLFKNVQAKQNQLLNQTQSRSMLKSPKNQKKIDPKQRRINLGLECLNQLNESAIQSLIHNQKLRATQSVHLKDESKRAFSPEEKKQIQEFMFIKKKQIDQDIENKKKDKLMKQQKLRLNLEILKNEIKEQISSCKSSKGGFNQNSNNLSNGQQNSSSKKAKSSSTRHFKSLTFSAPQFDNLGHQNSLYISQIDTNKADQFYNNTNSSSNLNQQDDQVFDYLYEEYKKNFNWRDQLEQNLHYQSLQNFHQSCSQFSNQKDESIINNQNKQLTSSSNQKSLSNRKKSNRSQSQKMEYNYQKQVSDQYYNNQNQFSQNKLNDFVNTLKPQRLQFQIDEDKIIQNDNQNLVISQQLGHNSNQDYLYNSQQQDLYQSFNAQQNQEFQQRKNQIYVQYTKLSQRIQKQIFKNLKEQKQINQYQQINQKRDMQLQSYQNQIDTQAQIYKQYSNRDKIQEIEEELYEQNDDYDEVSPHQNAYDIPNQYFHENEKSEDQKKLLNESFEKDQNTNKNYSLSIQNQQSSNQNSSNANQKYLQQDESAKLDYSNNMNKYDLYKLTELSSIKNSSVAEVVQKKSENNLGNNQQQQQNQTNMLLAQNQANQQFIQNQKDAQDEEHISDQKNNQVRQKSKSEQLTSNQNYDSPSKGTNLVDEIPTIQSDASSEFQAQYENQYQQQEEGYSNSYGMNEEELEEYMYYNIAAIYIQKVWRGFYTRKLLRDFFLELEEMYENQENDQYQKSVLTDQSQHQKANQANKNSQDDLIKNIQSSNNGSNIDNRDDTQIQQIIEKTNKTSQADENKIQGADQQIKQGYDFNSAKIVETMGSSDDNIQPILIDLNRKKDSKEQNFPLKNTTLQQKMNSSPQKNQEGIRDENQFKNNSGGKSNQNTDSQLQNQNKSSYHKNDLENLISQIDLNQKDQKLKNETLQMQEINEFSKSLLTLKDFEKSTENKYPSKTQFENGMKLSDENQITDSQYYDTPLNQQLIQDLDAQKRNDNFSLNQNINLIKDKYSETYQKIKEDQINKWSELISDLQKLQNQPNSQIDSEQIKKLCQKYENNKNQLIDQYQQMIKSQENKAIQENSPILKSEKEIKDNISRQLQDKKEINKNKQNEIFESSPVQKQKSLSKNNQGVLKRIDKNNQLSNMQDVLGSEQLMRDQSAIAAALSQSNLSDQYDLSTKNQYSNKINGLSQSVDFNENRNNKINKKKQQIPNYSDYIFEKLPQRDFASGKFNRLMLKKESMDELVKMREEIISYQKEAKLQIINQMFEQKKIPLQVYQTKLKECEQWALKELEKLQKNHHEIERGWRKFAETIKQTKRGIEFMKQIKKIDYNKILANSQDEIKFSRLLSFRSDSEASEGDVFSERKEYNSQILNINNLKNLSGISQGNGAGLNNCISPSNIKIVDQYQLNERPKKYINQQNQGLSLLQNGSIKGTNSINNYVLSKSCTSWDGNILNTNNSEEVEFDDINDYLKKIKNNFARSLSKQQLYGFQVQQNQNNQLQPQNSLPDESSSISPQQSRSNTPIIKNGDESNNMNNNINQTKKDDKEINDQNKINNFEISPNPKQKLLTQMTITQQSENDLKKIGLMSLESASSSVQSQSSEAQFSQHLFEYENAKKLQQQEKNNGNIEDQDGQENKQQQQNNIQKQISDQPNKELMSIEQKANIVSDKIIENLIDEVNNEIYEIKQKESTKQQAHYTENNVYPNINEVMPTNIEYKNQFDEKVIPIESCANLNSIKDFLVALAEFIKENFREEFLGRINLPLGIDPLEFLKTFNITENTEPQDTETSNAPIYPLVKYIHVQKPVVSEEIFLTFNELYQRMIRKQKKLENRELYFDGQEEKFADDDDEDEDIDIFNSQSDIEKYNLKLIFDCFNEALDFLRPFSLGGKPLPWKLNQKKLANLKVKDQDIERVLGMAIGRTLKWGSCLCGFIPEKIEFPPGQDEENNEYLNQIKEDRLAQMLENEVLENEHKWLIYEEEETDVQLEIADDIFHSLMSETAQWLYLKMQGKLELMDALQINVGRDQKMNFDEMIEDEEDQKQLLDYQAIQDGQKNNTQSGLMSKLGAANILTQKRFKNSNEANIHANIEELYAQSQNQYLDDDNLIVNLDDPSNYHKRKRKAINQNNTSEDQEYNELDDSDNYENEYYSNKKTAKAKEEISQKRRQGKQEEIQSKQNEKLIFQHRQLSYSPSNQYNQFQQSPVEFGDIQQKYNQLIGSTNSKASSLNSSF